MEYEDRLTITTPEGVELELQLAGLGSRFVAQLIDLVIKAIAIVLVIVVFSQLDLTGLAIIIPAVTLILYGYDVLFETFANGRTPGKRPMRLRVLKLGGEPIDFMSSAIRNALRLVEGFPTSYIPAIVSVLSTKKNQRLGDLAAGTIVIHEEAVPKPSQQMPPAYGPWGPPALAGGQVWDVSAVGGEEIAAVRSFLERRWTLDHDTRGRLALQLAQGLWHKVGGAPNGLQPEAFLEQLAQQKAGRG
jgi:uncharacterized RDD family membrane protein YckC